MKPNTHGSTPLRRTLGLSGSLLLASAGGLFFYRRQIAEEPVAFPLALKLTGVFILLAVPFVWRALNRRP